MIKIINHCDLKNGRHVQNSASAAVSAAVADIIADVIKRGDAALREYTERYDGCLPDRFELPGSALDTAISDVDPDFVGVLKRAASNIEEFHSHQVRQGFEIVKSDGVVLGQRIIPIERVGLYIPGGTAAYPSTVLMNCIPAKIAGVSEVIIATPPLKNGKVNPGILAAAKIAGADRVFTVGGAQAIAALAFGTETVPRVDKITGPGNAYVAEAKRQVFGAAGIDMLAGPSDILIIADDDADPALVAADLLAQCEHGVDSPAVLITCSQKLAEKVSAEIEEQLSKLPRGKIARTAIDDHGKIIITDSIDQAFTISNELAPEHLSIFLEEPRKYLDQVKNAGSVFLGRNTPEALCDYCAGPNHTLPTSGTARFSSPLSVDDFVKKTSFACYTEEALRSAGGDVIRFAEKEGLAAHAASVQKRMMGSRAD